MIESRHDSTPTVTLLDAADLHYFNEGTHSRLYEKLGAHPLRLGETQGTYFAVWAPNAAYVYVMGDFIAAPRTIGHLGRLSGRGRSGEYL